MAELTDALSLERTKNADIRLSYAQMGKDLAAATAARNSMTSQLGMLQAQSTRLAADRDAQKRRRRPAWRPSCRIPRPS